jgi:TolB-like protein
LWIEPEKNQEYFSDGLTEELITSLSQVPGLRVAARTSSFQFKGQNADVKEVAEQLDVGSVLEGSVRKSGDRLRVSAQLISVENGYQLCRDSYDREHCGCLRGSGGRGAIYRGSPSGAVGSRARLPLWR